MTDGPSRTTIGRTMSTRPRLRLIKRLTKVGPTLALGALVWWVLRSPSLEAGGSIDYTGKLNALARVHQPGGPDAPSQADEIDRLHDLMLGARTAVYERHAPGETTPTTPQSASFWNALGNPRAKKKDRDLCRAALVELSRTDFFDRLSALRDRPVWRELPPNAADDGTQSLRRVSMLRAIGVLCRSEMEWARSTARYERVGEAFERGMLVAELWRQEPTIIGQLTSISLTSALLEEMAGIITDGRLRIGVLPAVESTVAGFPDELNEKFVLEVFRLETRRLLQSTHTDGGEGEGTLVVSELGSLLPPIGPDATVLKLSGYKYANAAGPLFSDLSIKNEKLDELIDGLLSRFVDRAAGREPGFDPNEFATARLSWRDAPLRTQHRILVGLADQLALLQLQQRALPALWAIEMHHLVSGEYPARLEDIPSSLLASIPLDPFSPGQTLCYRLRAPDADDPRGYLLYSVGADGVDDGGADDAESRWRALDAGSDAGLDLVLNPPR